MWEQIRANRIKSVVLVAGMAGLLLVIGYLLGEAFLGSPAGGLAIALVLLVIMNLVAFYQGDNIMLSVSKAKKIQKADHPRLFNIVEEMQIASGLSRMPDVYIIDDPAMNAFATGRNEDKAAVAVTTGLLQKLNRDELQGVLAHEMAHVKNRDVLLMSLCSVLLGTIVILAFFGSRMMLFGGMSGRRSRSSSGGGGQAQMIIMLVALVFMILAPIFARLIYLAVSRKREYVADASAAVYTRYPEGLASALEKLGGSKLQVQSTNQALAPMFIVNPFRRKGRAAADLSSTHPPLSERIRILRSMSGGASFADYNTAYQGAHKGGGSIIGAASLAGAGAVGLRQAGPDIPVGAPEPSKLVRTREVSNLMWQKNNYRTIDCRCGTRLRVPPDFKQGKVRCPHCGEVHPVTA